MARATAMPVVVVAGLHRAARTRVVDDLLLSVPRSVAVHHDLTAIATGEVHCRVRDRWGVVDRRHVDLVHSCLSCTLREDLLPLLLGLARRREYGLCVIETWEGVDPRMVADAFGAVVDGRPVAESLSLAAVVTAVDAERLVPDLVSADDMHERGLGVVEEDDRAVADALIRQIEYPTVLALVGGDSPEGRQASALLEHLNPAAAVVSADEGRLPLLVCGRFDDAAAAVRLDPACAQYPASHRSGRVCTVTWRRSRPMDPGRLHAVLDEVVDGGLRSRGRFWLADRDDTMLVWDGCGGALSIGAAGPWLASLPAAAWELVSDARRTSARIDWRDASGDRCQCLSFTGIDLDPDRITALLDSCLLTDAELENPERPRAARPDPFADVLGTAP